MSGKPMPTILVADDDDDDILFLREAFADLDWEVDLRRVKDGTELLDYLYRQGEYADAGRAPSPHIILLDLNMPTKNGREVLKDIKGDRYLRSIPVIVLTTSGARNDIEAVYDFGGNAFVTKPENFMRVARPLRDFWFNLAALPCEERDSM